MKLDGRCCLCGATFVGWVLSWQLLLIPANDLNHEAGFWAPPTAEMLAFAEQMLLLHPCFTYLPVHHETEAAATSPAQRVPRNSFIYPSVRRACLSKQLHYNVDQFD